MTTTFRFLRRYHHGVLREFAGMLARHEIPLCTWQTWVAEQIATASQGAAMAASHKQTLSDFSEEERDWLNQQTSEQVAEAFALAGRMSNREVDFDAEAVCLADDRLEEIFAYFGAGSIPKADSPTQAAIRLVRRVGAELKHLVDLRTRKRLYAKEFHSAVAKCLRRAAMLAKRIEKGGSLIRDELTEKEAAELDKFYKLTKEES